MRKNLSRSAQFLLIAGLMIAYPCCSAAQITTPPNNVQPAVQPQNAAQSASPLAFDVATIKPSKTYVGGMGLAKSTPDGVSLINVTAKSLIANAYGIKQDLITGAPGWAGSSEYDIEAKVLPSDAVPSPRLNRNQISVMMRALLADRFKLAVHTETREIPIYELTLAKGGSKLHAATPGDTYPNGLKAPNGHTGPGMMMVIDKTFIGQAIPLAGLVDTLSLVLHRPVVDKTGLTGKYDITLPLLRAEVGPEPMPPNPGEASPVSATPPPDPVGPSLFTAIEEDLGLKLVSATGPGTLLVVDHIEKPSEN